MNWKLPNQLTVGRLLLSVVFFVFLATVDLDAPAAPWVLLACFAMYIAAGITDVLDGYLARRWKLTSAFGRMADPIVDKIIVCGAFALLAGSNFAWAPPAATLEHRLPWWLHGNMASGVQAWMVVVIIGREFIISGIRGYSESQGILFPATPFGKVKMFVQSVALCTVFYQLAFLRDAAWASALKLSLVWLTVLITLGSGLGYLKKARAVLRSTESDAAA